MHNLNLLDSNGNVPHTSGLNWGQNSTNHTRKDDAYIAIRVNDINSTSDLFLPLLVSTSESSTRRNEPITVRWDDGTQMTMLFEGNQEINGEEYAKQLSSCPNKNTLGEYLKSRLDVPLGKLITNEHLDDYGRTNVTIALSHDTSIDYILDFSI
tara:strand:- start:57 stop:518 length:462 start_codon:yes stop_codon:yes gene_type:complete